MKRGWIIAGILAALAAGGALAWRAQPVAVAVAAARVGPAVDVVYATGYVEPQQPVTISARITAPVARILVGEGDRVRRGQPLVLLADDEQRTLIAQAAAQRRAAELTEHRTVVLAKQGWVTRAARDQAVANADAARAGEATALVRRDQLVVRADSDGIVTRRDIYPGELAVPGKALLTLGDPARVWITATVDERDIARIAPGQAALLTNDAYKGRTLHARVGEVTPAGDPTARAFRVRLLPEDAGALPLGLSFEINIVTHRNDRALLIPAAALVDGGKVWVVADGRARPRQVRTGTLGTGTVEITSGVAPGEKVVVNPPAGLAPGARVRASAAAPPAG